MAAPAPRDAKREGGVVTTVAGHAAHWKFATVFWTSERQKDERERARWTMMFIEGLSSKGVFY